MADNITNYKPPKTGRRFMQSDAKVRLIKGPVGCLHGSTLVVTEFGAIPIAHIDRPMRVLSWNEKTRRFQLSWCGGSFPKGKDYLYRVSTPQGEFDASAEHLLLCADGEYRRVSELRAGDALDSGSPAPLETSSEFALRESHEDALRLTRTAVGYLGDYAELARLRGRQLLRDEDNAQVFAPPQGGVPGYARDFCPEGTPHAGVLKGLSRLRTRLTRFFSPQQTPRCGHRLANGLVASEGRGEVEFFGRASGLTPSLRQFLTSLCHNWRVSAQRFRTRLFSAYAAFCSPSSLGITNRPIISLTRKQVQEVYWDLQVSDTHNYVTIDGTVHHNSGKSTVCITEIFRRCVEMPKAKDGFRRSRWVISRNTNQQLKTTTFATWKQWFPPGTAGVWKESEKTFYLTVGDVKAEIIFLPLDTPDDAQRLLSLELTGIFFNEVREIAPEIITAAFSRLGRYPSKAMMPPDTTYWYGMIMDTNPPSRDSWLYTTFEEEKPEGWEIFSQPGGLEPDAENVANLPDCYYPDMMNGATEDWINVHVHGQYGRSLVGRPVYENTFKRDFHVADSQLIPLKSNESTILIGMDFGRTPAAVMGQRHYTSRLNVLDSLYVENIGLENFLNKHLKPLLNEKFPYNKYLVIGDPAGTAKSQINEENAFDVLKKCGFAAIPAPTNDVDKRIQAVESLLAQQVDGKAMLLFSPETTSKGMKHLIAGVDGSYMYKRKQNGSFDNSPEKNQYSHDNDALQYLCLGANLSGGAGTRRSVEVKPYPKRWGCR